MSTARTDAVANKQQGVTSDCERGIGLPGNVVGLDALSARGKVHQLGLQVRTGLHTGECELIGDDVGGIAVHIGALVASIANTDEVMVSSTVKDLVAGSGIQFADRGIHNLKGVPGEWRLFVVR